MNRLSLACIAAGLLAVAAPSAASPNLPLDDPDYVELVKALALRGLPLGTGGIRPLTEAEVQAQLLEAGMPADPSLVDRWTRGFWAAPLRRLTQRLALVSDKPAIFVPGIYSEQLVGSLDISCERQEGRPCGEGAGAMVELDSAAGYGKWVSVFSRFRVSGGMNDYGAGFAVDRAYLNAELGPIALEVGRDVLVLGPGSRTQLLLGTNAAPLDQIRISTAHPIKIPKVPARVSLLYAFARLRDPQRFTGSFLSIARLELELLGRLQLGVANLLEMGGEGAPGFSFGEFIVEHFKPQPGPNGSGISNRRIAFDVSWFCRTCRSRFYYEFAFEDWRYQFGSAMAYDTDHLLGWEMPVLPRVGRHGLLVEVQHTSPISQGHSMFSSGMTNAGRVLGSPLGPNAWSGFLGLRVDLRRAMLWPWFEYVRRSSDQYSCPYHQSCFRTAAGVAESRYRVGLNGQFRPRQGMRVDLRAFAELVTTSAFMPGRTDGNVGLELVVSWVPGAAGRFAVGR